MDYYTFAGNEEAMMFILIGFMVNILSPIIVAVIAVAKFGLHDLAEQGENDEPSIIKAVQIFVPYLLLVKLPSTILNIINSKTAEEFHNLHKS